MKTLRIISDIHGKYLEYINLLSDCEYSLQLGDYGFDYNFMINGTYHDKHKMFPGNHDNYDKVFDFPGCLGKFGEFDINSVKGFFISGGFSLDWKWRLETQIKTGQKIWWDQEQLSHDEMTEALTLYKKVKPNFVITHSCPFSVARALGNPCILEDFGYNPGTFTTNTQELLESCFNVHQPKLWIFGHFHFNKDKMFGDTRFICRPELGWTDVDEDYNVVDYSVGNDDHPRYKEK